MLVRSIRWAHQGSPRSQMSPHKLMYVKWGRPVGKSLLLSVGTFYSLYYLWEYLERDENKKN
ncbi:hypothetical protein ZYGR_0AG05280 [Zygosaccharomyces rouxii]|uniref:Uncharacterized protein n=1 Tax=Zygosaccharomyces rouxii TaxID=4956 RepID=A0A1Q3AA02_ZYGRO|nr:hypothetical protein ZYGR_0AG05280 [Zygosaccharomyces rouxii]